MCFFCVESAGAATSCTGASYYDANTDTCVDCPTDYDYNTTSGKTSITECQIYCPAGHYVKKEYSRLEYIESNGVQYIAFDYVPLMTGDGTVFYIPLSATDNTLSKLHVSDGITRYTAYDDSLIHNEREF